MDESPIFEADVKANVNPRRTIIKAVSDKGSGNFALVRKSVEFLGSMTLHEVMEKTTARFCQDGTLSREAIDEAPLSGTEKYTFWRRQDDRARVQMDCLR